MKGFLITYNGEGSRELTLMKNNLLGRVAKIKLKRDYCLYFYPGILDGQYFSKIAQGCYFVQTNNLNLDDRYNIIPVEIKSELNMETPRDFFRRKFQEREVKNLG